MNGEIQRSGLGYSCLFPNGIGFIVARVRTSRDGITAEITVDSLTGKHDPFIHWARVNLVDSWSRDKFITACRRRTPNDDIDWSGMMEFLCHSVIIRERESSPFVLVGGDKDDTVVDEWLIENFIYKSEPTVVFGDGGTGKSRFCLANALSVQTGIEFVPGMKPCITGPIGYLDWESNGSRLNKRLRALCSGIGVDPVLIHYRNCTEPLRDQVEEIREFCQQHGVVLLVVDSVEMAMAGTKDAGTDANDAAIKLYSALRSIGVASLLLDHVTKGDADNLGPRNEYGSIFKRNLARLQFELRLSEEGGGDDHFQIALFHKKRNDDGKLNDSVTYRVYFDKSTTLYTVDGFNGSDLITGLRTGQAVEQALADSDGLLAPIDIQRITGKKKSAIMMELTRGIKKDKYFCTNKKYGLAGKDYGATK